MDHVTKLGIVASNSPIVFSSYLNSHTETVVASANFDLGVYESTRGTLELLKLGLQRRSVLVFEGHN